MKLNSSLLLASSMLALSLSDAHATTLLTQTGAPTRDDFTGTIGLRFTVASAGTLNGTGLSVTSLGFQDDDDDGLDISHQVGIWDLSTGNLVAQTTVAAGTVGTLVDHYRYASTLLDRFGSAITSVTLSAGGQYAIGAMVNNASGDRWTDVHPSAGFTMDAAATAGDSLGFGDVLNGSSFGAMNNDGQGNNLRWAPGNMQFTVVPEPSAALLGSLGLLALLRRRRR